jgi:alkyl sulfatase BDS1-like metallo-beta-lactamase superfamily hydrolase
MADLLSLSSRIVDAGVADVPTNRVTQELSELDDGVALVESFSHSAVIDSGDGLVVVDASGAATGPAVVAAVRRWSGAPVRTLVYTHGHVDHVGGSGAFEADRRAQGQPPIEVVAHAAVPARFARYRRTDGWNRAINLRQFGGISARHGMGLAGRGAFLGDDVLEPDRVVGDHATVTVGDVALELHHARGETDDHLWLWWPDRRAVFTGDFVTWVFPNAGNPQKVQRYPIEWAAALRAIVAARPELLVPAHGLPIAGRERIALVCEDLADALEHLVATTLALMNEGAPLDAIVHTVSLDPERLTRPWLKPVYDEPEFVVRTVWRQFGGWWDQDPASVKPAPQAALAAELASLAGGALRLAERGAELSAAGDHRLACHLVELAGRAAPDDVAVHQLRAAVYQARRDAESSLMAKGIYADAARRSREVAEPET